MESTGLSQFCTSSNINNKSTTGTECVYEVNHPETEENDETLCDCNNRASSFSDTSSFITIDEIEQNMEEKNEDSLSEFDVGSIQSDDYISESAIEDDRVDHLSNCIKAQKDELINRLNETISSVKMTSKIQNIPSYDTKTISPQNDPDSETLRPYFNPILSLGSQDDDILEKSHPVNEIQDIPIPDNTYVDITKDRDDTIARVKDVSNIPLPNNTYVDITKDRENTIISTENTPGNTNGDILTEMDNSVFGIPEINDTVISYFNDSNISTSTTVACEPKMPYDSPIHDTLPPAVQILQNRDGEIKATAASSMYEEAYANLSELLTNETLGNVPTKQLLEAIDSHLESGLDKDREMLESMRSQIDDDRKSYLSLDNDDPLDDLLLSQKSDVLEDTVVANNTVIAVDSNENTLECPDNVENQAEVKSVKSAPKKQEDEPDELNLDDDEPGETEPGGAIINGEEDEEKLLASDDEQNVKVETKRDLKEFISQDQEENNDINDPQWEPLRNCKSEIEFFKVVRARWKNLSKPNPREDLTYHNKRNINKAYGQTFVRRNMYGKRSHSPEKNERPTKVPRKESCTYLFDTNIKNLMKNADAELNRINAEKRSELDKLAVQQTNQEQYANSHYQNYGYFRDMRLRQFQDTAELLARYEYQRQCIMEGTRQKIAALNEASREVRQYFEFYYWDEVNKGELDMCLTETEKREIIELENTLDAYNDFYKSN